MPENSRNRPYNVNYKDGYHYFETDQDIFYSCAFHNNITNQLPPLLGIYDIEISNFQFFPYDPTPDVRKAQDTRVSATLIELLGGYFEHDNRFLIFLCNAADGRPKERQTLFQILVKGTGRGGS